MKALLIRPTSPPQLAAVSDHPKPAPAPGEVLIRVDCAGICATDLEIVRGYMRFTGVPGHEFVGTVVAGPTALLNQRVVAEINCPCGECDLCARGWPGHCRARTVLGIAGRDGAFAEFVALPAANLHRVPAELSDEHAVFVEPVAAAVQVLVLEPQPPDGRTLVLGTGRLGLLIGQVLADADRAPLLVGRNPRTLNVAAELGLDAIPLDAFKPAADQDVVVECTGAADGLQLAMAACRPRGTLILKSTYAEPPQIDLAPIVIHELRVLGNRCGPFEPAIELLRTGRVRVEPLISATFPLSDGVRAFAAAAQPGRLKVLLRPDGA